ncbi:MAG: 4-hydroxythreonine-4-phosphate dehydrogenase PdxA, partial [Elusimicrobiota bacterium]|jgi:4-hydroxythreonine-4-phosphate dehydrogenase|nr:4-hydroxythreonine-4-phosphate dehydrogenase PdxA [Elusimicrobiota bacterium]
MTIGDIAGIGPELTLKAILKNTKNLKNYLPILIGNTQVLKKTLKICNIENKNNIFFNELDELHTNLNKYDENVINIVNIDFDKKLKIKKIFEFGKPDKITGKYSFLYLEKAINILQNPYFTKNGYKRLITAPISKKHWQKANIPYPAHTEALADLTNTKKYAMIFANSKAVVILATRHIAIKDVPKYFTKKSLSDAIDIGIDFLKKITKTKNKVFNIGICGLNPHVGEKGYSGREEIEIISPTLNSEKYKKQNIKFFGPFSGDGLFQKMVEKKLDIIIAAYHDQGIFPLKAMDYYGCVNISFGLPFIRISPGHGTAFDIAGKGIANEKSFLQAISWSLKI